MKATVRKEFKMKNGYVLRPGDQVEVLPPEKDNPTICTLICGIEDIFLLSTPKLGILFKEFQQFDINDLQEWVMDSICPSMTGQDVEHDGWDKKGFPSIFLAMGMI